jgi:hypothetical protein
MNNSLSEKALVGGFSVALYSYELQLQSVLRTEWFIG